jgi:cyclophilin family peptidyl-prolyl cis-trans isomerase
MRTVRRRSFEMFAAPCLEALDGRVMLDSAPLPHISDLNNPNHTVVRFETNFGDIDMEMFDEAAPITVANFLKYVRDGDYDRSFFHRLDDNFVLQGGLARVDPAGTGAGIHAKEIPVDAPIQNEPDATNRSNLARTIAMARRGGQVNSATSQFFFNLADNTFLNTVDQGFTVFARVVNDRSWQVLQDINALHINAQASPYNELPVTGSASPADGLQESELVMIWDAEVIKPQGVAAFYQYKYRFPEGFAGSTINEFVPIGNPNGVTAGYQVIVRSEVAQTQPAATPGDAPDPDFWYRDKVINTGTIGANRRAGITISQFSHTMSDLVQRGVPYSVEVWSTSRLSVNMSHYDFGSATGEAFTTDVNTTWALTEVQKGTGISDYILWDNPSDTDATVTITFHYQSAEPTMLTFNTQAFRRGGVSVKDIASLADGAYSAVVTSTQPIVASLTHYFRGTGSSSDDTRGFSTLGVPGPGQRTGILPLANIDTGITEKLSFLNAGTSVAFITLIFTFTDGAPDLTVTPSQLILSPGRRAEYDLANVGSLANRTFSVRYSSGTVDVYAHSVHTEHGDDLSAPFAINAATRHDFAEGFMNNTRAGVDLFETFSVYNPNITALGATEQDANITIRFLYTDGFVLAKDFVVNAGHRLDLDAHTDTDVIAQARDHARFFYSVEIVSDVPVVGMMRHYDLTLGNLQPSGGFATLGTQRDTTALTALT